MLAWSPVASSNVDDAVSFEANRDSFVSKTSEKTIENNSVCSHHLLAHLLKYNIEKKSDVTVPRKRSRRESSSNAESSYSVDFEVTQHPTKIFCDHFSTESFDKVIVSPRSCAITNSASVSSTRVFFRGSNHKNGSMEGGNKNARFEKKTTTNDEEILDVTRENPGKIQGNTENQSASSSVGSYLLNKGFKTSGGTFYDRSCSKNEDISCSSKQFSRSVSENSSISEEQSFLQSPRSIETQVSVSTIYSVSDNSFPDLSQDFLAKETMDFILKEAEKCLNIGSPSTSSQESDSVELVKNVSVEVQSASSSPGPSYVLKSTGSPKDKQQCGSSDVSENKSEDSDVEIEKSMVLVPSDPLEWSSVHIASWLAWCSRKFGLAPRPDPSRFPPSGAELCDLTRHHFQDIAGSERSCTILAKHIAHLRHSVTGRASSPLNVECKVFEDASDEDDDEEKG